jgi:hypothetical protein
MVESQENQKSRVAAFDQLGTIMSSLGKGEDWPGFEIGLSESEYAEFNELIRSVRAYNGWFTEEMVRKSLGAWGGVLNTDKLTTWLARYPEQAKSRNIGIVMAGNIPLVGFHDLLSVLIVGNKAQVKLSSDDNMLIPKLMNALVQLAPHMADKVEFKADKLTEYDAVIATGSNNTARYFEHYFKHVPHLIRKNRTSVAILDENTSDEDIQALGGDIFDYYGLGCRNISKMYVPESFNLDRFFEAIYGRSEVVNHNKYANNYDYNKAVWLLNQEQLLDNGFVLLKEDSSLFAPTASIYYERYKDESSLRNELSSKADEIQCVVSSKDIPFGKAQEPELWDYADGADTMKFLLGL